MGEVASFYDSRDAEVLGTLLQQNCVNGADLLDMRFAHLVEDMPMSPFLARKVLNLRDQYLHEG